jgi:hypothetical protein
MSNLTFIGVMPVKMFIEKFMRAGHHIPAAPKGDFSAVP